MLVMRSVGLKVLKNKLSEYVRLAASGETVLVTDRDRVVAELVPPRKPNQNLEDAFLERGVREGWLRPPLVKSTEPPPRAPCMSFEEIMADHERDRADG